MIEPNELRIGNLVIGNIVYEGKVLTFERFNESLNVVFFSDGSEWGIGEYLTDIQPIPITEEWLLKFGFSIEDNNSYQLDTDLGFSIWGRIGQAFNVYVNSDSIGNEKQYVHELQNLYFALTGKELKLI